MHRNVLNCILPTDVKEIETVTLGKREISTNGALLYIRVASAATATGTDLETILCLTFSGCMAFPVKFEWKHFIHELGVYDSLSYILCNISSTLYTNCVVVGQIPYQLGKSFIIESRNSEECNTQHSPRSD